MTEQQEQAIRKAAMIAVTRAFDDGLRTAAEMIRIAVREKPGISPLQVAAAIEATANANPSQTP
jgi:hypothetical protein